MTTTTEAPANTKTGWCSMCRSGDHPLCASGSCRCPGFGKHPNRPSPDRIDKPATPRPTPARTAPKASKPTISAPVWELVKADPPAPPPKPKRLTVVERARPLLEQLMAEGEKSWHRIAVFPSSMGAGQTRTRLAKEYREFEFKAVRVPEISQSAIYVRWTGEKATTL